MFVQSQIQRHHNHHQNSHNNNNKNNNHHRNQSQFHSSQHKHHSTSPVSHRRAITLNGIAARPAILSLAKSSTATAGLAYNFRTNEHVSSNKSGRQINSKSSAAPIQLISNSNKQQQQRQHLYHHSCEVNFMNEERNHLFRTNRDESELATTWRTISLNSNSDEGETKRSNNSSADACEQQDSDSIEQHRRHSYKDRTRSLGSHKSLKVYDFMQRNTRVARVEQTTSSTITASYCEPPSLNSGGPKQSLETPNDTNNDYSRCFNIQELNHDDYLDSPSESGNSLSKFIAGSKQFLRFILETPALLTGRLSCSFKLSQLRPISLFTTTNAASYNQIQSVELVRSFCMSFITYQLETWRYLANDLARENQLSNDRSSASTTSRSVVNNEITTTATYVRQIPSASRHYEHHATCSNGVHQFVHSATTATAYAEQLSGRQYHSLDRPILERQREVIFDDDEGSPVIRIPPILREPPPLQSAITRHHQHRHNHRHDDSQQSYHQLEFAQESRLVARPSTGFGSGYPMQQQQQQQHKTNHHAHHHHHHHHASTSSDHHQDESLSLGPTQRQSLAPGNNFNRRAKFYLGQHSLDCDHLQAATASLQASVSRQNREPPLLEKRDDYSMNNNYYNYDESWSDRPLSDDYFRSIPDCHRAKSADNGATDSKWINGNCDLHNDLQTTHTNNNLLPERLSAQKKRSQSMKKSSSPLSFDGARRRLGLKLRNDNQLDSIVVNRSEEVPPRGAAMLSRQTTFNSLYDFGTESGSVWRGHSQLGPDPRANFVEGIGFGQIASRQALVSPRLGDIQLSLSSRRGMLEVEVIRARGLHARVGAKLLPSPYVKVYLMKEKKCIAKCRTHQVNQTLDPLYQEPFVFRNEFKNCVLQVIVWGDYGKRDRKSMMGIVQIHLDDLDISNMVIGWYKLFNIPSMTNSLVSSKNFRQQLLHLSSIGGSPINN